MPRSTLHTPTSPSAPLGLVVVLIIAFALLAAACGGDDDDVDAAGDDAPDASDPANDETVDDGQDEAADTDGSGSGTATVDGTTFDFPDASTCEIGSTAYSDGEDWRKFTAWSEDGHNLLRIVVGTTESNEIVPLDDVSVNIGLTNANTLDEGNADHEWVPDPGNEAFEATVTPDGASGTAAVVDFGDETPAGESPKSTVEWSFSCG